MMMWLEKRMMNSLFYIIPLLQLELQRESHLIWVMKYKESLEVSHHGKYKEK